MSYTSQKHRNFCAEPVGEKAVTDLPGIGFVLGRRLEARGIDRAYMVLGEFLALRKDEELFKYRLHLTCWANVKHQNDCCDALLEWCNNFL